MSRRTLTALQRRWIAERTTRLVDGLARDAWSLGVEVSRGERGETVVDCGVGAPGSWEAGRRVVEIAHGGLGIARIGLKDVAGWLLPEIVVESCRPTISAYGLQVSMPLSEVDSAIRVSGPIGARCAEGRIALGQEEATELAWGVAVVESDRLPTADVVDALAERSGLAPSALTLLVAPSGSVVGTTQIAGRINECVLFTLEESMGIDCTVVTHILGATPIAPAAEAGSCPAVTADDLIHYAGRVVLEVDAGFDRDFETLAERLTFASTSAYGRRFADLLAEAGGVFEAIPGLIDLHRPARVTVASGASGSAATAGADDEALLAEWLRADTPGRTEAR